jgi:magnesium transporter
LALARKQSTRRPQLEQALIEKQHLTKVQHKLQRLHPADIAYVLENVSWERRKLLWQLLPATLNGAVLLELSDSVREGLLADLDVQEVIGAAQHLDSDEIAELVPDLPKGLVLDLLESLERKNREEVQNLLHFPPDSVGALMDLDMLTVRDDVEVDVVLRYLRRFTKLPDSVNRIFVVNREGVLQGVLDFKDLLVTAPDQRIGDIMERAPTVFLTTDKARDAALAFDRYDLLAAPVVNAHHHLVGNLGVEAVVEYMHAASQHDLLGQAGIKEEDLFAPVWHSSRNRWPWLALNLVTAFVASRAIGLFEDEIVQLVALAALMPIVASIGGNCANQTVALVIRGLALKQISRDNFRHLFSKELAISLINGLLWGVIVGLFSLVFYQNIGLAVVLLAAMLLTIVIGALSGLLIPMILQKIGRDPVMGSSVIATSFTDILGFFIFLGLASIFLL